jgi:hypothetical protein
MKVESRFIEYINEKFNSVIVCGLMFLLFCNQLIPKLPLDKVGLILLSIYLMIKGNRKTTLSLNQFILIIIVFLSILSTTILNIFQFEYAIWTGFFGILLVIYFPTISINIKTIFYLLSIYIFISLLLLIYAYITDTYYYVHALWDKGLYDGTRAPMGFSPTVQVLGTFCNIAILIFMMEYKNNNMSEKDYFIVLIPVICIAISYSRSSQLVMLVILGFRYFKYLLAIVPFALGLLYSYDDKLFQAYSNIDTLISRLKFLDGFLFSFFSMGSNKIQTFGYGTFYLDNFIVYKTNCLHEYVENIFAGLLQCYGLLGFFTYSIISFFYIQYAIKKANLYLIIFVVLYLLVIPQFTHELLTTSLFMALGVSYYYLYQIKTNTINE